jgi:predicted nucleic acid-binding protein
VSHVLDANVISELRKPVRRADAGVRAWVSDHASSDLYLSTITVLEIEIGIGRVARRGPLQGQRSQAWLDVALVNPWATF